MRQRALAICTTALILATGACHKDAQNVRGEDPIASAEQPAVETTADATSPDGPRKINPPAPEDPVNDDADTSEAVTYEDATFEIDRVAGGKRFQGSWLLLPSGRELVLSYRPMPEHFDLVGKKVVATGKHYSNPPHVQSIGADHFQLHSLKAAPGETPISPKPTSLPAPPLVNNQAEFRGMLRRWVQLRATLVGKAEVQDTGQYWVDVILELEDGTQIHATFSKTTYEREYAALEGKRVSTTGRAWSNKLERWSEAKLLEPPKSLEDIDLDEESEDEEPERFNLGGNLSLCEGDVDGCGMTREKPKGKKPVFPPSSKTMKSKSE